MAELELHVLVVDDNDDILFMLETMLKHKGYKVTIRDNAEEFEKFLYPLMPDLIVMDMLLSGADGCEICKEIKANTDFTHISVLMLSADPNAETKCSEAGADKFMSKPFEMNELLNTINLLAGR